MVFSYNWLQSFFAKKLPAPQKLAEILTLQFAEIEEVKKVGSDFTLDIDIRPNRAGDCFSHLGIAREIAVITNSKLQIPAFVKASAFGSTKSAYGQTKSAGKQNFITVEVKDKEACLRYTALVMEGVKIGPSPQWLKERLAVCGLNPINNVVDVANYVMLETGQPLHAFDGEKIAGKKIIVRYAKKGEKINTLDGQKFNLNPDILVIADANDSMAIAGIKGGKIPEVNEKTKNIVLESANFDPKIIRKGSKALGLKTDASLRFEHGLDPNLTELAAARAAYLIQKVAGGKIARGSVDIYPQKVYPKRIKLDLNYVASLLGIKISLTAVKNILKNLGFRLIEVKTQSILVEVPTFRRDITIPEDLVEEIGRIYGYEKIVPVFPNASLIPAQKNENVFWEGMVKNVLKEVGLTEVYNYSFIGDDEAKNFHYQDKELIELENPTTQEQKYLRPSLIPNLLRDVQRNQKHFAQVKIFELGKVFSFHGGEKRALTGLITGEEFYYLKGVVDELLQKVGISDIWYDDWQASPEKSPIVIWHPKKIAEIKVGNVEIGFLGEVSPRILGNLKIAGKVVVFDIDFDELQKLASEEHEYLPLAKFPAVVMDLAILVPLKTKVEQVLNEIETAGGSLVRDVDLFDIYEGDELPGGQKNLAFHIIYQSENRTLTSKEAEVVHQKIIKTLERNPEWQVRK